MKSYHYLLCLAATVSAIPLESLDFSLSLSDEEGVGQAAPTHVVYVGASQQHKFRPEFIKAGVGDIVRFELLALNHSVTQSTLYQPCAQAGPFDTDFLDFNPHNVSGFTADLLVTSTTPQWFFCRQRIPVSHCSEGMVFAINPQDRWLEFKSRAQSQSSQFLRPTLSPFVGSAAWSTNFACTAPSAAASLGSIKASTNPSAISAPGSVVTGSNEGSTTTFDSVASARGSVKASAGPSGLIAPGSVVTGSDEGSTTTFDSVTSNAPLAPDASTDPVSRHDAVSKSPPAAINSLGSLPSIQESAPTAIQSRPPNLVTITAQGNTLALPDVKTDTSTSIVSSTMRTDFAVSSGTTSVLIRPVTTQSAVTYLTRILDADSLSFTYIYPATAPTTSGIQVVPFGTNTAATSVTFSFSPSTPLSDLPSITGSKELDPGSINLPAASNSPSHTTAKPEPSHATTSGKSMPSIQPHEISGISIVPVTSEVTTSASPMDTTDPVKTTSLLVRRGTDSPTCGVSKKSTNATLSQVKSTPSSLAANNMAGLGIVFAITVICILVMSFWA